MPQRALFTGEFQPLPTEWPLNLHWVSGAMSSLSATTNDAINAVLVAGSFCRSVEHGTNPAVEGFLAGQRWHLVHYDGKLSK